MGLKDIRSGRGGPRSGSEAAGKVRQRAEGEGQGLGTEAAGPHLLAGRETRRALSLSAAPPRSAAARRAPRTGGPAGAAPVRPPLWWKVPRGGTGKAPARVLLVALRPLGGRATPAPAQAHLKVLTTSYTYTCDQGWENRGDPTPGSQAARPDNACHPASRWQHSSSLSPAAPREVLRDGGAGQGSLRGGPWGPDQSRRPSLGQLGAPPALHAERSGGALEGEG